jgi:hypothetical protein
MMSPWTSLSMSNASAAAIPTTCLGSGGVTARRVHLRGNSIGYVSGGNCGTRATEEKENSHELIPSGLAMSE